MLAECVSIRTLSSRSLGPLVKKPTIERERRRSRSPPGLHSGSISKNEAGPTARPTPPLVDEGWSPTESLPTRRKSTDHSRGILKSNTTYPRGWGGFDHNGRNLLDPDGPDLVDYGWSSSVARKVVELFRQRGWSGAIAKYRDGNLN
jgi:hypothetical protein